MIIMADVGRQCVDRKADISNCSDHKAARYVRFHSRDNRLKGDRCNRKGGSKVSPGELLTQGAGDDFRIWRTGMLSRALMTATVTLLVGWLTAIPAKAENLEAGKSPSQIFSG